MTDVTGHRQALGADDSASSGMPEHDILVTLLGAVAAAANEGGEPLAVLANAVAQIGSATGWPVGHVVLVDPVGGLQSTAVWWLPDNTELKPFRRASDAQSLGPACLPGRVVESGRPAWIADLRYDADFSRAEAADEADLRSAFALPVRAGERVVAVLEFFARGVAVLDSGFLAIMTAVGAQLGRVFERAAERRALVQAADRSHLILEGAADAFVSVDAQGRVTEWNAQAEAVYGWAEHEAIGRPVASLIVPEHYRAAHDAGLRRLRENGQPRILGQRLELEGLRRSGETFPLELTIWGEPDSGSGATSDFYSFSRDITERKAREAELARRALHDELTGLPNRSLITDRIEQALARRARTGREVAVLFCDLDRFKLVNDSLGHAAGDRLLQAIATRLRAAVRPADTVGRVAGDEFAVVCDDLHGAAEATHIAQRILAAFDEPLDVGGQHFRAGTSVGIALAGSARASAETLLRDADAAMYRAKEQGGGRAEIFDERTRERIRNRLRTELDLSHSVDRDELRVHYQPIVALNGQRLVGVEALVRWQHPQRGLLTPGEFLPMAEETGMIETIGAWVLREATQQARAWQEQGWEGIGVAVNLSARQLTQSGFVDLATDILDDAGLDTDRVSLDLEVTESVLMRDPHTSASVLGRLRELGFRLAIDDFGTGYSSLAFLRHFAVDAIKIHPTFIADITSGYRGLSLVTALVELADALDMTVLAEGVENRLQRDRLASIGCDLAQGYYFAEPAPADQIATRFAVN